MKEVSNLVALLTDKKLWKRNSKDIYKQWKADGDFLFINYERGQVIEADLLALIKNSEKSGKLQYLIYEILFLIEGKSYTDEIVNYCVYEYADKSFKPTILCALAHLNLTTKQLETVNKFTDTSEAFYQLLIRKLKDKTVTCGELKLFIEDNLKFLSDAYCFEENINTDVDQEKINTVKYMLELHKVR